MPSIALKAALLLLTAATAGCQARTHSTSSGSSGGSIPIQDAGLNMQAATLSYPAGWQAQGEINRSSACGMGSPYAQIRVLNQSQQLSILQMTPFFTWSSQGMILGTNIRSCGAISQLTHASDILQRLIAPQLSSGLQGAQVGRPEPLPGHGPTQGSVGGWHQTGDSARLHVSYTADGRPREEWIQATTIVTYLRPDTFNTQTTVSVLSAPQGHLEAVSNVFSTGIDWKNSPRWEQANTQDDQNKANQINAQAQIDMKISAERHQQVMDNMKQSADRHQMEMDTMQRNADVHREAAKNNEDARHDSAQATADYVGDKTRYWSWRNTVTGATTTTTTRQSPGTNWVPN